MTIKLENPALRMALEDVEKMNTEFRWAELTVEEFTFETLIYIKAGRINSEAEREQAIKTRYYYLTNDGTVDIITITHV